MTLNRFRGPNGIVQMIALIESASADRRAELLRSIATENPGLASLIKTKVLTIDSVLQWSPESLARLFHALGDVHRLFLLRCARAASKAISNKADEAWVIGLGSPPPTDLISPDKMGNADVLEVNLIHSIRELERVGRLSLAELDPVRAA